jgi:thiamine pyrophosphate-dependent acetolactate synthase large subunit-like protein
MLAVEAIAEEIARQGVREVFTYMSRDIIKLMAELSARGITIYQARHEHGAVGWPMGTHARRDASRWCWSARASGSRTA